MNIELIDMILQKEISTSSLKFNFPKPKTPNLNTNANKTMITSSELVKTTFDYKKQKIEAAENEFIDFLSLDTEDVSLWSLKN
jgi:hypothetical protein